MKNINGDFTLNDENLKLFDEPQNKNPKNEFYSDAKYQTEINNKPKNYYNSCRNFECFKPSCNDKNFTFYNSQVNLSPYSINNINNDNLSNNENYERRRYYITDKNKEKNLNSNTNVEKNINFSNENNDNNDFSKPYFKNFSNPIYTQFKSNKKNLTHTKSNSISKYHYKNDIDTTSINNSIKNSLRNNISYSPEYIKLKKENDSLVQENILLNKKLTEVINQLEKIKSTEIEINSDNNNNDLEKQLIIAKQKLIFYENSLKNLKEQYEDQIKNYLSQISNCNNYLQTIYSFFNNIKNKFYPNLNLDSCNFQNNNLKAGNNKEFSLKFQEIEKFISDIVNELNKYKLKYPQPKTLISDDVNNNNYNSMNNNLNTYDDVDKMNSIKNLEQRILALENEFKQSNVIDNNDINKNIEFQNDMFLEEIKPRLNSKNDRKYSSKERKIPVKKRSLGSNRKKLNKSLEKKLRVNDYGMNNLSNDPSKKLREKSGRKHKRINKKIKKIKKK